LLKYNQKYIKVPFYSIVLLVPLQYFESYDLKAEKDKMPPEKRTLVLTHFPRFLTLLEEEIYNPSRFHSFINPFILSFICPFVILFHSFHLLYCLHLFYADSLRLYNFLNSVNRSINILRVITFIIFFFLHSVSVFFSFSLASFVSFFIFYSLFH